MNYDLASFAPRRTLGYSGEGWGLTRDREGFILSDGSERLRFLHPDTFREVKRVTVTDGHLPVRDLNELEYIRGEIYANVWHTDRIARISPQSGQVTAWIDLRGLMSGDQLDSEAVLNGIAYDAAKNRLFVSRHRQQSYEYESAARSEQYCGELRWNVAWPLLQRRLH